MKKLIFTLTLVVLFISSNAAHAELSIVNCNSHLGTDHNLSLVIVNNSLREIRIQTLESRIKALVPRKLMNQCIEGRTLFAILGSHTTLELDDAILSGGEGLLKMDDEEFGCK